MASLRWKKARNARPDIQADVVYSGDYTISLRPENFTVSYRPAGRHVPLGSYGTLASAKKAAAAHASDPAAFEALLHANTWGTPPGYVPPGHRQNRAGLSVERKRSPMLGGGTLADYEAAARARRQGGPAATLTTGGRQTVAMTPGGTIVTNRAGRRVGRWGFYARRGDGKVVAVGRVLAEQIAESPAGTREDYLTLWLVPPFYVDAGEGKYRAEKGFVPVAWEHHLGKRELPDDFLGDPRAWLERVKREDYPHYERSEVGASLWNLGTVGARRRTRGLRSMNMAGARTRGVKTDLVVAVYGDFALYGASADPRATSPSYWRGGMGDEPIALFRAKVPHDLVGFADPLTKARPVTLVEALEKHGTTEQWFSDGYEGWNAVVPYVSTKKPFYVSHEYDEHAGPFKRGGGEED